jgi:cytochrome c
MNSIELNKIVGAVLLGGFVLLLSSILAKNLVQPQHAGTTAMVAPHEGGEAAPAPTAEDTLEPVIPLLATADLEAGETAFKKCATCHTIEKGGANKVGPNLWGSVGAPHAHAEGFNYSEALKSKPGSWDYESLNAWLHSPKTYAPGTKMTFAGIKKVEERANLIAWLRTQSDSPLPLPDAAAVEAAQQAGEAPPPEGAATGAADVEATAPAETGTTTQPTGTAEPTPEQQAAGTTEQQAPATTGEQTAATPPAGGVADLVKAADPAAGEKVAAKCKACHSFEKGGPNKVGPNLWNIVGAKQAHLDDFKYSDAIKGLGGQWTYDELDKYLTSPREYAPGTKMVFPGIKKPEDRAAVIAYLRSLSDSPQPLP